MKLRPIKKKTALKNNIVQNHIIQNLFFQNWITTMSRDFVFDQAGLMTISRRLPELLYMRVFFCKGKRFAGLTV